jgi:hypothetical protein
VALKSSAIGIKRTEALGALAADRFAGLGDDVERRSEPCCDFECVAGILYKGITGVDALDMISRPSKADSDCKIEGC